MSKTQLSKQEKVLRDTGGPLAEAHIHILLKLLEQEPTNIGAIYNPLFFRVVVTFCALKRLHDTDRPQI
jgi:hypothetical protein